MQHRHALILTAGLLLTACNGEGYQYSGFQMSEFFSLDGQVTGWTFGNRDDTTLDYVLDRTLSTEPVELEDGSRVFTFTTSRRCVEGVEECGAGFVRDLYLSSNDNYGTRIHGYDTPTSGRVDFDNPLRLAKVRMAPGEVDDTLDVDGHDFTVTLVSATAECYQTLAVEWQCAELVVASDPPGHWLEGTWYAAPGYNIVAFERTGDPGLWRIIKNPTGP